MPAIAMLRPTPVRGYGRWPAALCDLTSKVLFDAFAKQYMRVVKPVAYKVDATSVDREHLVILLYFQVHAYI